MKFTPKIYASTHSLTLGSTVMHLTRPPCQPQRIIWAFKLNPFERLNLRFDATPEDVKRQYRKLSLMVHPDKCKHEQASTAFDSE